MRINPSGYYDRNERIISVVLDEIYQKVWEQIQPKYAISVWSFHHEDDTFTLHWAYNEILDAGGDGNPIVIEPMVAFANSNPLADKVVKAITNSGVE